MVLLDKNERKKNFHLGNILMNWKQFIPIFLGSKFVTK